MKQHQASFSNFQIVNSLPSDMDLIFHLFESAVAYQQKNNYELWPRFSRELIQAEMDEKRHWKIMEGENMAGIFSVMYSDPVIWGYERDREPSVYLHRIATNPDFKGKCMMRLIKDWALEHARQNGKKYVRMDTWGHNENLRAYYVSCGFNYIGQHTLVDAEGLPSHYGGSFLSLFQLEA
jgi:GNAT superfamily N-acetyltransferase